MQASLIACQHSLGAQGFPFVSPSGACLRDELLPLPCLDSILQQGSLPCSLLGDVGNARSSVESTSQEVLQPEKRTTGQ